MRLNTQDTALQAHLRDLTRQTLGPSGTVLDYLAKQAHAGQCCVRTVVERIRARLDGETLHLTRPRWSIGVE
jgi:hypothetical protein